MTREIKKGINDEDILPRLYIKQFKAKLQLFEKMCDVVLSCDEDSERMNAFIKKIMEYHNFKP